MSKINRFHLKIIAGIFFTLFLLTAVALFTAGTVWKNSCESFLANTLVSGEYDIEKGDGFNKTYNAIFGGKDIPAGFTLYLIKIRRFDKNIHYGYYTADEIPLETLITNIMNGKQTLTKITFPEGYNMYDVAAAIENSGINNKTEMLNSFADRSLILKLTGGNYESIEGFLAPGTYFFAKNYPAEKIIAKMVNEFYRSLPYDFDNKAKNLGLSFYDALILASIVQKETYDEKESPLVAAVFINRIKSRMLIQADPTIIYGIYDRFNGQIRRADINDSNNRFNTYQHKGLPPTPISNPSLMALNAVINPADSDFYYFVATKTGKHVFAKDYDEHKRNVRIHQLGLSK
ncbi:MAG: endolytic transglycosylase MltG [Deferribacteraceae bacterium]|nr:endolytic transglycosylase MltG [Deferribacteraceae bacterium]